MKRSNDTPPRRTPIPIQTSPPLSHMTSNSFKGSPSSISSPRYRTTPDSSIYVRTPTTPAAAPGPASPTVLLSLKTPSMMDMWILCHQIGTLHDLFIDKITAISLDSTRPKVLQKNLMFKMSEEALIIAREFAAKMHDYLSTVDLGQRKLKADWSIDGTPSFQKLSLFLDGWSDPIFGSRLGKKLDLGKVYSPPYLASSRYRSNSRLQGIPEEVNRNIVRGMEYNIDDWNKATKNFIVNFDPYRPSLSVKLMMDTANSLRRAADAVIKLVEYHYRIALGVPPIEGTSEAEMVYRAMVGELDMGLEIEVEKIVEGVEEKLLRIWAVRDEELNK